MTNRYGETTWAIAISDGIITSSTTWDAVSSDAPGGNIIYLFCNNISYTIKDMDKVKQLPGGATFRIKLGKQKQDVMISNALIVAKLISDINKITTYINEWKRSGESPLYFWARAKESNGSWDALKFMNSAGTMKDYLRCHLLNTRIELTQQKYTLTASLTECEN